MNSWEKAGLKAVWQMAMECFFVLLCCLLLSHLVSLCAIKNHLNIKSKGAMMNAQNQKAQEISPQKPKKVILRLLELSGEKKTLLIFSSLLSSLAAICQFVPYFAGYYIV